MFDEMFNMKLFIKQICQCDFFKWESYKYNAIQLLLVSILICL